MTNNITYPYCALSFRITNKSYPNSQLQPIIPSHYEYELMTKKELNN
jgi:hypothetical protein